MFDTTRYRTADKQCACVWAGVQLASYFYSLLSARHQVYLSRREQDGRENESGRGGHLKYRSKCNTPRNLLNVLPDIVFSILKPQIEFRGPVFEQVEHVCISPRIIADNNSAGLPSFRKREGRAVQQRGIGTWNRRESTLALLLCVFHRVDVC